MGNAPMPDVGGLMNSKKEGNGGEAEKERGGVGDQVGKWPPYLTVLSRWDG